MSGFQNSVPGGSAILNLLRMSGVVTPPVECNPNPVSIDLTRQPLIYLNIAQILVSVVLVLIILAQVKEGGSGLFGSAQSTVRTRRGLEKTLFQLTIALSVVFVLVSILSVRLVSG